MADETKKETVTLNELMVSTLAMSDAAIKLLIQKCLYDFWCNFWCQA